MALEPGHEHAEGDRGRRVGERRADQLRAGWLAEPSWRSLIASDAS